MADGHLPVEGQNREPIPTRAPALFHPCHRWTLPATRRAPPRQRITPRAPLEPRADPGDFTSSPAKQAFVVLAQLDIREVRALMYAPLNDRREVGLMTKNQLVSKLAEEGGVSKKQADELLSTLVTTVIKSVKKGEPLKIPGLGIFRLRKMKARMGRNPQTGEAIKIPARKKVGFTVAKSFKETVLGTARK